MILSNDLITRKVMDLSTEMKQEKKMVMWMYCRSSLYITHL